MSTGQGLRREINAEETGRPLGPRRPAFCLRTPKGSRSKKESDATDYRPNGGDAQLRPRHAEERVGRFAAGVRLHGVHGCSRLPFLMVGANAVSRPWRNPLNASTRRVRLVSKPVSSAVVKTVSAKIAVPLYHISTTHALSSNAANLAGYTVGMNATFAPMPELMSRLERLATERHTDRDTLLSEAISAYLEREEATALLAQINAAHTDDPDDEEAAKEEESLARSRRYFLRLLNKQEPE